MKNKSVFPVIDNYGEQIGKGITIHQYYAAMAMQGIIACPNTSMTCSFERIAKEAFQYADAMIEVESSQQMPNNEQQKKQECPQCGELLVFPRGDDPYCEDCGYPDDYFDDYNTPDNNDYFDKDWQENNK